MPLPPTQRLIILGGLLLSIAGAAFFAARFSGQNAAVSHLLDRGLQEAQAGRYEDAQQSLQEAQTLAPRNVLVQRSLAETLRMQGRWDNATEAYAKLAKLAPQEPHIHCQLAELTLRSPQDGNMESRILKAVVEEPDCLRAQLVATQWANATGDQKKELGYLEAAYRTHKNVPLLTTYYARQLQNSSQLDTALVVTKDFAERYPGYGYAQAFYGSFASKLSEKSAQTTLEKAVRLDPLSGVAQAELGFHDNTLGQAQKAIPSLEAALLLRFDQPDLLFQLAKAWRSVGRTTDADRLQKAFDTLSALQQQGDGLKKRRAPREEVEAAEQKIIEAQQVYTTERQRLEATP